jgi:hypothetical protein
MRYAQNILTAVALTFIHTTFAFTFILSHAFGNVPSRQNSVLHGGCSMQAGCAQGGPALKQKTALVTGATDGIGLHTATKLASSGYFVLIHGRYLFCRTVDLFCKIPELNFSYCQRSCENSRSPEKNSVQISAKCFVHKFVLIPIYSICLYLSVRLQIE